jgi:hypothetical protein
MLIALNSEQMYCGGSTLRQSDNFRRSKQEAGKLMINSRQEIESARLSMLEARKALEDYEILKGTGWSCERKTLIQLFTKATGTYLRLSANER